MDICFISDLFAYIDNAAINNLICISFSKCARVYVGQVPQNEIIKSKGLTFIILISTARLPSAGAVAYCPVNSDSAHWQMNRPT